MTGTLIPRVQGLCYGGDYNPEQWPEDVWTEDVALMREAGVNLVTVGVFAWAHLEPAEGRYEFGWLDRVLDLLHDGGIRVDLATATASPPPWFSVAYPRTLPVARDGRRLTYGSRQAYCPSAPEYRQAAARLVEQLATRYGDHPALALWHVNNEYGCHVPRCYCDVSAESFRAWLRKRHGDLDGLNAAWGTAFWSQRYTDWAQVLPPRPTPTFPNPTHVLDFRRFSSDELLACFTAERDLLHRMTPDVPVTTNLMPGFTDLDYWAWSKEMTGPRRLLSSDHYLLAEGSGYAASHPSGPGTAAYLPAEPPAQIAYAADLSRSLAGGSWLLMEHSTSAVNWQARNLAKPPGQLIRDSLGHVARGSEGALYFQWRASRAGAEKWHSAMLPHAGTDSKVWREVVTLGRQLAALADVAGARTAAPVALLLDYPSAWAQEAPAQPSDDMVATAEVRRWHAALWRAGFTADIAHPAADLSAYRAVFSPALYLLSDEAAANLAGYVAGGGTLAVGPYSGIVDEHDHVRPAPMPGALASVLGVAVEEFFPLRAGVAVHLDDGTAAEVWTEVAAAVDAEVLIRYADGPVPGGPALTRRRAGGTAWYLTTRPSDAPLAALLARIATEAGAAPTLAGPPPGVEAVRRRPADGPAYLFLFNHSGAAAQVDAAGVDLLTGTAWPGPTTVEAGGVVVLREGS